MNTLAGLCFVALGCVCTITGMLFAIRIVKTTTEVMFDDENNDENIKV